MANRTFGWVQNPSSTDTLKNILSIFVPQSQFHSYMVNNRLPFLKKANLFKDPNMFETFLSILNNQKPISYNILKGQGAGILKRSEAKCSGLAQAAITGQQFKTYIIDNKEVKIKKPYTDDWTADGFLRWAVSLGFLDYNYADDTCEITESGINFVYAETEEEKHAILGQAYLSYPPVCRILELLSEKGQLTKFELGSQLGFTDEAGFTSIPQNIWVQIYNSSNNKKEKRKLRNDLEGSSDKYARMICTWLIEIGWVNKKTKKVTETFGSETYTCNISSAFEITGKGIINYRKAIGKSKQSRIAKIVYREMLASKASNVNYLRIRRSLILEFLANHKTKNINDIHTFLLSKEINEPTQTIIDDLTGLINIGIDIERLSDNDYILHDIITKLTPYTETVTNNKNDIAAIKEKIRQRLHNINHKYLTLIDQAFSGKNKCLEFEIYTIDLLVNELNFKGCHLGGASKPDSIFYHDQKGVIVDNKAYSKGFKITRQMADEMIRYIQENNDRNPQRNQNQWWSNFGEAVNHFNFLKEK